MSLLQKVKRGMGSPDWNVSMVNIHLQNSCECTALDMLEWREMTEQMDWQAKQPSQVVCFSEDLKCWEAWDTTCGLKAMDITPVKGNERGSLKGWWSHEHWNHFRGNVGETPERWGGVHMGFSERIDTILNWTNNLYYGFSFWLFKKSSVFLYYCQFECFWRCSNQINVIFTSFLN